MTGKTTTWVVAIAAAAILGGPLDASGQIPPAAAPATAAEAYETEKGHRRIADEHLHKAAATLDGIAVDQQPIDIQNQLAELQRRVRALRQDGTAAEPPTQERETAAAPQQAPLDRKAELAAIDQALAALLGEEKGRKPEDPRAGDAAVGTAGASQAGLDAETRRQLEAARTHITAYAAATEAQRASQADGASVSPSGPPGSPVPDAGDATAVTSPVDPTPTPTGTSPTDVPQTPATPEPGEWQAAAPGAGQAESEEARRHLLAARNTLSELTQMPRATAIAGEVRAQVSQLISRFNELIAADAQWREPLDRVNATLENLLRPRAEDTPVTQPEPGEPVGTTGIEMLSPDIRAKLVEFRDHLQAFEQTAGGAAVPADRAEPQDPPTTTTTAAPGEVATRVSETDPTAASGSTSSGSPAAQMPAPPAGTVGGEPMQAGDPIASEAQRHIEAIEAILVRHARESGDGVTGTAGTAAGPETSDRRAPALERGAIEEIRTHLDELRRLVESRGR